MKLYVIKGKEWGGRSVTIRVMGIPRLHLASNVSYCASENVVSAVHDLCSVFQFRISTVVLILMHLNV